MFFVQIFLHVAISIALLLTVNSAGVSLSQALFASVPIAVTAFLAGFAVQVVLFASEINSGVKNATYKAALVSAVTWIVIISDCTVGLLYTNASKLWMFDMIIVAMIGTAANVVVLFLLSQEEKMNEKVQSQPA
jgi:hypothetical protein